MEERPIDIVKFEITPLETGFSVVPSLRIEFKIKSETREKFYLLFGICRLELFESIKIEGICYRGEYVSGHWRSGDWKVTAEVGLHMESHPFSFGEQKTFVSDLELDAMKIAHIMEKLKKSKEREKIIKAKVFLCLGLLNFEENNLKDLTLYREESIPEEKWYRWIRKWKIGIDWVFLPSSLANKLRELRAKVGVSSEWEVISELIKKDKGLKPEVTFLSNDSLEEKIRKLISDSEKELLIMCRALDKTFEREILDACERGVNVRVILVPIKKLEHEKYLEPRRLREAIKNFSSNLEIRQNEKQHARAIVTDKGAIVGSTDPDYYGINVHTNASIYTTDVTIRQALRMFFCKLWDESNDIT